MKGINVTPSPKLLKIFPFLHNYIRGLDSLVEIPDDDSIRLMSVKLIHKIKKAILRLDSKPGEVIPFSGNGQKENASTAKTSPEKGDNEE